MHAVDNGAESRRRAKTYLGFEVAHRVVLGYLDHQILDPLRKAHHQLAWWDRTAIIEYILWNGICTLLAFGFLAEGLHMLQVTVSDEARVGIPHDTFIT